MNTSLGGREGRVVLSLVARGLEDLLVASLRVTPGMETPGCGTAVDSIKSSSRPRPCPRSLGQNSIEDIFSFSFGLKSCPSFDLRFPTLRKLRIVSMYRVIYLVVDMGWVDFD